MGKYKIGSTVHIWFKSGGGQIYTIVGKNKHFLFLSYGNLTGEITSDIKVVAIADLKNNKPSWQKDQRQKNE